MNHKYTTKLNILREAYSIHHPHCGLCLLESQIKNYKISLYERPLKPEEHNQNAVVFELKMPPKIECLRDVLYLFVTQHYNSSCRKIDVYGKWSTYDQISQYARSKPANVFLGSTTQLVKKSHYGHSYHPDQDFSSFIVDNGYNCTYFSGTILTLPTELREQSVKKYVSFTVENPSLYSGLQWTIQSTSHTQNSVLAKQSECPREMSLNQGVSGYTK